MGFLDAFGKILQGKPVFDPHDEQQRVDQFGTPLPQPGQPAGLGQTGESQPIDSQPENQPLPPGYTMLGPKAVPVVQIRRVECHNKGTDMDVYADIHNDSQQNINVDRIMLAGSTRALGKRLRPGEAQQFLIYSGPRLRNNPQGYAEVQYATEEGGRDYFIANHRIRAKQEPDNTFSFYEFTLVQPIRDIH